jgi:hypothetical protein
MRRGATATHARPLGFPVGFPVPSGSRPFQHDPAPGGPPPLARPSSRSDDDDDDDEMPELFHDSSGGGDGNVGVNDAGVPVFGAANAQGRGNGALGIDLQVAARWMEQTVPVVILLLMVGRYTSNALDPYLQSARFQPLNLKYDILVSSLAFKCNLHRYSAVFVYKHARAILTFAWMTAVLFRANDFLRTQVALRSERKARCPPLYKFANPA